ncbi:hypothetical protein GQ42DRAFT_164630, partial [Ramicandelaber brevisporus]
MRTSILSALVAAIISLPIARAHMMMAEPCVRGSNQPQCKPWVADANYDSVSPISTHDNVTVEPICGTRLPLLQPYKTYQAGGSIAVNIVGGTPHNGGHCAFSVSYDGGQTFVTLMTVMDSCISGSLSYNVPIPATAPSSDKVIFLWTWNNATGNRELYALCSDIRIQGMATGGYVTGPKALFANYGQSSPLIPAPPEFSTVGKALYDARPIITVTGNGGTVAIPPRNPLNGSTPVPQPPSVSTTASYTLSTSSANGAASSVTAPIVTITATATATATATVTATPIPTPPPSLPEQPEQPAPYPSPSSSSSSSSSLPPSAQPDTPSPPQQTPGSSGKIGYGGPCTASIYGQCADGSPDSFMMCDHDRWVLRPCP